MKRRLSIALTSVLVVTAAGFLVSEVPQGPPLAATHFPAPEFPGADSTFSGIDDLPSPRRPGSEPEVPAAVGPVWINSSPLAMAALRGKVVLIDFWEYTCINCIRTFTENKKWYARYRKYGFTLIGVHAPEFDIAYSAKNVRAAVERFGLPYPVVVDSQFKIWSSYHNSTWPNRFLVDARGIVRFNRPGEGGDAAFERAIQALLQEAHPGLNFPADYAVSPEKESFAPSCGIPTAEMYVGDWEGRGILANPEGYRMGKTVNYHLLDDVADGRVVLSGPWHTDKNGMTYRGKPTVEAPTSDQLKMRYHARELYAVMNVSHGRPSRLYVLQDEKPLTETDKGVDVQVGQDGKSFIEVREPRMYYLVRNPSFGSHTVTLVPTRSGLTVNSFTFGNDCQTDFPHL